MTVSIVTYKTDLGELETCLASLRSEAVERIWIIDNSSMPEIENFCRRYPNVEYAASKNVGYGAAHNVAIRKARLIGSNYHLVLNSDVRFNPTVLDRLERWMERHGDVGIVQPKVTYADGSLQPTARLLPAPTDVFGRRFLPKSWIRRRNARYTLEGISDSEDSEVPYLQGSFLLMRMKALENTGDFDERFFMYPEDIDICRRMWRHWKVVRHPEETIVHDHRAASYHNLRLLKVHAVNMIKYFNKWGWMLDGERKTINHHCLKNLKVTECVNP